MTLATLGDSSIKVDFQYGNIPDKTVNFSYSNLPRCPSMAFMGTSKDGSSGDFNTAGSRQTQVGDAFPMVVTVYGVHINSKTVSCTGTVNYKVVGAKDSAGYWVMRGGITVNAFNYNGSPSCSVSSRYY